MNMRLLCCLVLSCAFAGAQTRPAAAGASSMASGIFQQLGQVQVTNRAILEELSKTPPATQAAARLAVQAADQARTIRQGVEDMDQHYDSMTPQRQEALRRAWSIAVIMDACSSSARDSAKIESGGAAEMRTGADCALRRSGQLDETLAPFKEGYVPPAPAPAKQSSSPRRAPRSN